MNAERANREGDKDQKAAVEFAEYLVMVQRAKQENRTWRLGQTYANVLYDVRKDISENLVNDPFYNDEVVPAFLDEVVTKWGVVR